MSEEQTCENCGWKGNCLYENAEAYGIPAWKCCGTWALKKGNVWKMSETDFRKKAEELIKSLPTWKHYIIRGTIPSPITHTPTKVLTLRCDKYSEYAYSENVTTMFEVKEMMNKIVEVAEAEIKKLEAQIADALQILNELLAKVQGCEDGGTYVSWIDGHELERLHSILERQKQKKEPSV